LKIMRFIVMGQIEGVQLLDVKIKV
jgi:hypothetical protein